MGGTGFLTGFTIAPLDLVLQTNNKSTAATPNPGSTKSQSSSSATASTTNTAATPRTASPSASNDATLKTALAAGLGVGIPLLAALLVALFFLARLVRIHQDNAHHQKKQRKAAGVEVDGGTLMARRQEMESPPSEMPGERALELGV